MNTKKKEIELLNIQIIATIIYLGSLILSIYLTYNDKLLLTNNKKILTEKQSNTLSIANRIVVVVLTLIYLYISYSNIKIAKEKKNKLKPFILQLMGSELSTLSTIIVLYAVLLTSGSQYSIVAGVENPTL